MTMAERVAVLENKVDDVKQDVGDVKLDVKEVIESLSEFKNSFNNFCLAIDKTYAKKSEVAELKEDLKTNKNRVWAVLTAVASGIIGLLIYLIKIHLN